MHIDTSARTRPDVERGRSGDGGSPLEHPSEVSGGRGRAAVSIRQLRVMRAGYLFLAAGLAVVEWPRLPGAHALPLFESVVACLLTAMSLLALLGLRHPVAMLPVLLFEVTWKLLWLGLVALPAALHGDAGADLRRVSVSCALVVVIMAVLPWRFAWSRYAGTPGDPWRATAA